MNSAVAAKARHIVRTICFVVERQRQRRLCVSGGSAAVLGRSSLYKLGGRTNIYHHHRFPVLRPPQQRIQIHKHYYSVGAFSWPLAEKASKGGEDSFFFLVDDNEEEQNGNNKNENGTNAPSLVDNTDHNRQRPRRQRRLVGGVADGVGGSKQPDLFSNTLMETCRLYAQEHPHIISPKQLLSGAYNSNKSRLDNIDGSSTACLVVVEEKNNEHDKTDEHEILLHCANLGDSGYMVVRDETVVARSTPQLHGPNTPYQLGKNADLPHRAAETTIKLQRGDVVALCTDGVFDNIFDFYLSLLLRGPEVLRRGIDELLRQAENRGHLDTNKVLLQPLRDLQHMKLPSKVSGSRQQQWNDGNTLKLAQLLCAHSVQIYTSGICFTPWDAQTNPSPRVGDLGKPDDVTALIVEI